MEDRHGNFPDTDPPEEIEQDVIEGNELLRRLDADPREMELQNAVEINRFLDNPDNVNEIVPNTVSRSSNEEFPLPHLPKHRSRYPRSIHRIFSGAHEIFSHKDRRLFKPPFFYQVLGRGFLKINGNYGGEITALFNNHQLHKMSILVN